MIGSKPFLLATSLTLIGIGLAGISIYAICRSRVYPLWTLVPRLCFFGAIFLVVFSLTLSRILYIALTIVLFMVFEQHRQWSDNQPVLMYRVLGITKEGFLSTVKFALDKLNLEYELLDEVSIVTADDIALKIDSDALLVMTREKPKWLKSLLNEIVSATKDVDPSFVSRDSHILGIMLGLILIGLGALSEVSHLIDK